MLREVKSKPISFEVFSDDFSEMRRQALKIHQWQDNVYVKIPITNTRGESSISLIEQLAGEGVKLNITALLTPRQVKSVAAALNPSVPAVVSVFAGRIADTGVDPLPIMKQSLEILRELPRVELLWASVREVLNVFQAAACRAILLQFLTIFSESWLPLEGKTSMNSRSIRSVCFTRTPSLPVSNSRDNNSIPSR